MKQLQHLQKYQNPYGLALTAIFLTLNAAVLATSVLMEASRSGNTLSFRWWDPFVWEFSSALGIFLLVPALYFFLVKMAFNWQGVKKSLAIYTLLAVLFSVLHVSIMVLVRKFAYLIQGRDYDFGPLFFEFIYELRKDLVTFLLLVIVIQGYRFIVSRLIGEAKLIAEENNKAGSNAINSRDHLLVKKLGKEFIVKLGDVEWMESSGNYVNLHIKGRIYPIRKTLSALSEEVATKGFCRVHRSHAINLDFVESIEPLPSGDGEISLKSGKTLNLLRRYKEQLKQRLS